MTHLHPPMVPDTQQGASMATLYGDATGSQDEGLQVSVDNTLQELTALIAESDASNPETALLIAHKNAIGLLVRNGAGKTADGKAALRNAVMLAHTACRHAAEQAATTHALEKAIIAEAKEAKQEAQKPLLAPIVFTPRRMPEPPTDDMLPEIVVTAPRPVRAEPAVAQQRVIDPLVVAARRAEFETARTSRDYTVRAAASWQLALASTSTLEEANAADWKARKGASLEVLVAHSPEKLPEAVARNAHDLLHERAAKNAMDGLNMDAMILAATPEKDRAKMQQMLQQLRQSDQDVQPKSLDDRAPAVAQVAASSPQGAGLAAVLASAQQRSDAANARANGVDWVAAQRLLKQYQAFDLDGDGTISFDEFDRLRQQADISWQQIAALTRSEDDWGISFVDDRRISKDDFKAATQAIAYLLTVDKGYLQEHYGNSKTLNHNGGSLTLNDLRIALNRHGIKTADVDTDGDMNLSNAEIDAALRKILPAGELPPAALPEAPSVTPRIVTAAADGREKPSKS